MQATVGELRPDAVARARELVEALSRFCRSVEEIAILESDVEVFRGATTGSEPLKASRFNDPKAQLLALTELVQQTLEVLGELFGEIEIEIEASRTTRFG